MPRPFGFTILLLAIFVGATAVALQLFNQMAFAVLLSLK